LLSIEPQISRWVIENDLLEAIMAFPTDMFYNTGIATSIAVQSNHKPTERRGKIKVINSVDFYQKLKKSLGNKYRELGEGDIELNVKIYGAFEEDEHSNLFYQQDFGSSTLSVAEFDGSGCGGRLSPRPEMGRRKGGQFPRLGEF
jgi:type I restriction enzyme M protein